jgi:hypothetical protein
MDAGEEHVDVGGVSDADDRSRWEPGVGLREASHS